MSKKNKIDRKKFKKMSIEDRVQMVENLYIDFPRNDKTIKAIRQHHAYAKFASEPEGLLIQGETGAGKTTILKVYMNEYPRTYADEVTRIPVLYAKVPTPATCKQLAAKILEAIGDPAAERGTQVSQTLRLKRYIEACGVELLILDEFQHFQDRDSLRVLKTVSDWLKLLMEEARLPIILSGLPYSHTILDAHGNEQLRRRFSTRIELEAFEYETAQERQDFRRFLNVIDDNLPLAEKSDLADPDMALCIYEATQGLVAHLMKLVRRATVIALEARKERVTLDFLSIAYEEKLAANNPERSNPFGDIALVA